MGYRTMPEYADRRPAPVTVYWRPGCPYCSRLRHQLRRAGIEFAEVDIWADPQAAARVRHVAAGNETVPTVFVGSTALVNPSPRAVLSALGRHRPERERVAEQTWRSIWSVGRVTRWLTVGGLLVASELASRSGHLAASYGLDGAAAAAYVGLRWARR